MTTHLQTSLYGLVTKPWIFSRCGSRNEAMTELIHGERIVSQPFKTATLTGHKGKETVTPIWGEPLDVMADCGHVIKVPHQTILDGEMIPCYVCENQVTDKALRKQATKVRQAERRLQEWLDKNQAEWREMKRRKR